MRLRWSPEAADDLEGIVKYIAQDNPEAGREVAVKIREGLMGLRTFPYGGRAGHLPGSRELVVAPYIVVYRVKNEFIEISRIYHGAQDWP